MVGIVFQASRHQYVLSDLPVYQCNIIIIKKTTTILNTVLVEVPVCPNYTRVFTRVFGPMMSYDEANRYDAR